MTEEEIEQYGKPLSIRYNCVTTATHKKCPACEKWLSYNNFQVVKGRSLSQRAAKCTPCVSAYIKVRRKQGFGIRTPEQRFEKSLRSYGLTREQYDQLMSDQDGKCAICGNTSSGHSKYDRLCIDHCHETAQVRGLLCHLCNAAIGMLQDDPELIEKAADYLRNST